MSRPSHGPYAEGVNHSIPVRHPSRKGPSKMTLAHWKMVQSCRELARRIAAALAVKLGELYLRPAREAAGNRTGPIEEWDPRKRRRP